MRLYCTENRELRMMHHRNSLNSESTPMLVAPSQVIYLDVLTNTSGTYP